MSMFTRRHYVWLTSVCRDISRVAKTDSAIQILADALKDESPEGFNRQQFLDNIYRDPTDHLGDESCPLPKTETSSN